ncbi:MAG: hypothetical protein DIU78_000790 [Pseudomonadota bacterium]|nr:MAG: hypothetical protein DIU78_11720 [Pseudomonadota bacterium]
MTTPISPGYPTSPADLSAPEQEAAPYAWAETTGFEPAAASGYISSGELLAWLALTTGNTYDDMRWHMMGTEARRDLTKMLTELKSLLQQVKETNGVAGDIHAKAQQILDRFGGSAYGVLDPGTRALLDEIVAVDAEVKQEKAEHERQLEQATQQGGRRMETHGSRHFDAATDYRKASESWITHLDGTITSLGTSDQLALIKIQELNGQISQATQLASNIIAAHDRALTATITNVKA